MTDQERLASGQYELAREGDLYAIKRRLEAQLEADTDVEADEPTGESTLVPGAAAEGLGPVGSAGIESEIDITGGPRPRTPRYLPDLTAHKVRDISLADLEDQPTELMTKAQWAEFRREARTSAQLMLSLGDFDHCLQMAQMQLIDALCHAVEYCRDSVRRFGEDIAAEAEVARRQYDGSEIRNEALQQIEGKRRMAAIRYMFFNNLFGAMLEERERQVRDCPFTWDAYRSHREMRKAKARRDQQDRMVADWIGLSESQYRRKLARLSQYEPRGNGVDAGRDERRMSPEDQQRLRMSQRGGR